MPLIVKVEVNLRDKVIADVQGRQDVLALCLGEEDPNDTRRLMFDETISNLVMICQYWDLGEDQKRLLKYLRTWLDSGVDDDVGDVTPAADPS